MNPKIRQSKETRTIQVDIVSAEGVTFSGRVRMITAPVALGEVGVLPGHSPMLAKLDPGEIRIHIPGKDDEPISGEGEELFIFTSGGFMEVQPSAVTVLTDTALRASDIDEAAAIQAKRQAEAAMLGQGRRGFDYARAKNELAQAIAQLKTLENAKKRARNKGRNWSPGAPEPE